MPGFEFRVLGLEFSVLIAFRGWLLGTENPEYPKPSTLIAILIEPLKKPPKPYTEKHSLSKSNSSWNSAVQSSFSCGVFRGSSVGVSGLRVLIEYLQ